MPNLNNEVTTFLDELNHPLRDEIERLRHILLGSNTVLAENIKWNGPNYSVEGADRITMKIQPPKQIQLIFHRGAKKLAQPTTRLIQTECNILRWKENDRAVATFNEMAAIDQAEQDLKAIVAAWIQATR